MSLALSAVSCLRDNLAPAFFRASRVTDNSPSEDLSSPPPEISLRCRSKLYRLKKPSCGVQKKESQQRYGKREQMQVKAEELSSGVVLEVMELSQ